MIYNIVMQMRKIEESFPRLYQIFFDIFFFLYSCPKFNLSYSVRIEMLRCLFIGIMLFRHFTIYIFNYHNIFDYLMAYKI